MFQKSIQGSSSGQRVKQERNQRKQVVHIACLLLLLVSCFDPEDRGSMVLQNIWLSLNCMTLQLRRLHSSHTLLSGVDVSVQEGGFTWRSVRSLEADTLSPSFLTDFERRRSLPSSFFTLRSYGSSNL